MRTSEQIDQLATALALAQGQMAGAKKDQINESIQQRTAKYADLASVWDACRAALSANGLSVVQTAELGAADTFGIFVTTILLHKSGQFIESTLGMPCTEDPHGIGSAITYSRRYALAAMVGVAPDDDDDGNAARSAPVIGLEHAATVTIAQAEMKRTRLHVVDSAGKTYTAKDQLVVQRLTQANTDQQPVAITWKPDKYQHGAAVITGAGDPNPDAPAVEDDPPL